MNDDALAYSRHCGLQKVDADYYLKKYSNLIKWTENAKILDIGCAEGTVTRQVLLPKIPPNFEKFVLADVSPNLLNLARKRFGDPRIEFLEIDIREATPVELHENFDHIFSFYCLNWIDEERTPQTVKNIFNLLKPGGRVLMTTAVTSPLYELFTNAMKGKKWTSCMSDFKKTFSPYHGCDAPDEKLRLFLQKAGFEVEICKFEKRTYTYDSWEQFMDFVAAIIPFSKISSQIDRNKFIEDFNMEAKRCSLIKIEKNGDVEKIHTSYSLLVAFASRPVIK